MKSNSRDAFLFGRKIDLPLPISWMWISALGLFVCLIIATIFALSSGEDFAKIAGTVEINPAVEIMRTPGAGVVAEINVSEGDFVRKGLPLVIIEEQRKTASGDRMNAAASNSLTSMIESVEHRISLASTNFQEQQNETSQKISLLLAETAAIEKKIRDSRRLLELIQQDFEQAQSVAERGFLSKRDLLNREISHTRATQDVDDFELQKVQKQAEINALRSQTLQSRLKNADAAETLAQERAALLARLSEAEASEGFRLNANQSGIVSAITVQRGSIVTPDRALLALVPEGAHPYFQFNVPVDQLGPLELGTTVEVEVVAYPYKQFGTLQATVSSISRAAIVDASSGDSSQLAVIVKLDLPDGGTDGLDLRQGMTVVARIKQARSRLFGLF